MISDYKCNIAWLLLIIINFITAVYFEYIFNELDETDECVYDYDCDLLLTLLIDKNNFLFVFMFIFGCVQVLILCLSLISNKFKLINDVLANIFGLVYLNTSLWHYSILNLYYYDMDFFAAYRFYMKNNYLSDPIRLSVYYYLIGEMIGFMVNFLLIPLFFIGFTYLLLSLVSICYSIRKN